ncbi:hypothetical protein bcere0026_30080 [Bacillus mycoides]|uniref:Uncharacterized protein n=1 Tax=Bacillus mycoides TaxID=1405 RepID=C2XWD2_BACMY|nr:hypothetical protein bcere0026_30080 [Bacillus mycoides]
MDGTPIMNNRYETFQKIIKRADSKFSLNPLFFSTFMPIYLVFLTVQIVFHYGFP